MALQYEDLRYLILPLPEDIRSAKEYGDYDRLRTLIRERLAGPLAEGMRARLELELVIHGPLEHRYTDTKEESLRKCRERIRNFTEEEFDRLEQEGRIDWHYTYGEKRYLDSAPATLVETYPALNARAFNAKQDTVRKQFWTGTADGQEIGAHIHIRHELRPAEGSLAEGTPVRVHLPLPVERDQIRNLVIHEISPEPARVPDGSEAQPTAYFESVYMKGRVWACEYSLENRSIYRDLTLPEYAERAARTAIPDEEYIWTEEQYPHIVFTPMLWAMTE
ncbi:MAG: hypothetical protein IJH77_05390 [Mogibacterium sp.]|nr:hypothetical protein [Mogibacterium sp.]